MLNVVEVKKMRCKMNILAIDIETMPNPDMISKLPEVVADSRLKDEEKIKADIEKKKAEQIEKMALSPLYGKIACIANRFICANLVIVFRSRL